MGRDKLNQVIMGLSTSHHVARLVLSVSNGMRGVTSFEQRRSELMSSPNGTRQVTAGHNGTREMTLDHNVHG